MILGFSIIRVCRQSFRLLTAVDYIFLTHAHRDHAEDAAVLAKKTGATILAGWELAQILMQKGVSNVVAINKGGSRQFDDLLVTAVQANHSGGFVDEGKIVYGGDPMGYVMKFENDYTVYHAGDTNVFGDMALLAELYKPELVMLPIGDAYTMGPYEAAKAVELLQAKKVVPMHFGGMDFLTGTPEKLREKLNDRMLEEVVVYNLRPGETLNFTK